ncbi:lipoprotein-anchoring transpeptidase ErfK/SrfK [Cytobacillus horneckiae]|uniref:L,D-transpeptidase n=1 Tax=Cytobacillus horneckiae TaxID=549687 RepID=A0A2N0Z9P7_9BACI|nr:L,D-transpeptidase [Cytobacillus horneckiae]MBN6888789.1 L,D-transpeptidase [Cytobacillus horneckiae]MCM3180030.1 L,D-transpeptidase [Cytobacillus horneckiae]MEC1155420.1 L,D-transpeptidase [Cytobacillus horneckiae]MED2936528.1 L,D-transpeptidase [Cytobacillus horneckiae]PKG26236.1 L,D-transpeptidase [Cytobacillus horneckiae]
MLQLVYSLFIAFTLSPLWPLGQNPLPGDPFIIVNKTSNEVAFIDDNQVQTVLPAATGKEEKLTPEGLFTFTVKAKEPYYRKKEIKGGDPANPLGTRWLGFDALNTDGRIYGIHGTNNPESIGKYVSNGCIRLQNAAVESLFDKVPIGSKILITSTEKSFEQLGKDYGAIK